MSITVLATNRPHLARLVRLDWDDVRESYVLLAPEGVLVLNQTGATILRLCDGERTVEEIVEELRGQYDRVSGDEVGDFLGRLAAKRWVVLGDG
jgi:pyrroloquinoline quinone biosynthesis protein D